MVVLTFPVATLHIVHVRPTIKDIDIATLSTCVTYLLHTYARILITNRILSLSRGSDDFTDCRLEKSDYLVELVV